MKLNFFILFTSVSMCLADEPPATATQAPLPEITKKRREVRDGGQVIASAETVYRGKDRVLETIKYTVARGDYAAGGGWRVYRVGNKPVLLEEDYKGDGNVTVRVFGKDGSLENFEVFKRRSNGSVELVSTAELAKLKRESQEMAAFSEGFSGWLGSQLKTNSPEKVLGDIKKVGDALKTVQEAAKTPDIQNKK